MQMVLQCLREKPLGTREAMQVLGLQHRPTFLYDYLQPAIDARLIEMTQPESPRSPTQKYRLTAKAMTLVTISRDQHK